MEINKSIIERNQDKINFWVAKESYKDLVNFVMSHLKTNKEAKVFDYSNLFNENCNNEEECVNDYCVRTRIIKIATETCELFCKALLIKNGKEWNELKSLGHNLLNCYNSLSDDDKLLIESFPMEMVSGICSFYPMIITPPYCCEENYKSKYPDEYEKQLIDCLAPYSTGTPLSNIKSRYPGEDIVTSDARFILGYTILLFSFCVTKKYIDSNLE